jgi:cytochrome c oxidase subunit 2
MNWNLFNYPMNPPQASNFASEHDALFYAIVAQAVFFGLLTFALILWFAFKFKKGSKADRSSPQYENARMEFWWVLVPTVLGLATFFWSTKIFVDMRTPPKNAKEIFVVGKQWMWHVQHPDGVRENNTLHVPIDTDIKITMISQDVIHAFYIPAFRVQFMTVPGRYTQMWFRPTKVGRYHLFCNMYCGTQHSEMGGSVIVMPKKEYADWLAQNGQVRENLTAAQTGEKLFNKIGCGNCHGANDLIPRGPSLRGIFGKSRETTDGRKWIADESYIRESIMRPAEKVTKGYGMTMPAYDKTFSEEDIMNLIAYIKSGASQSIPTSTVAAAMPGIQARDLSGKAGLNSNAMQFNSDRADATSTRRGSAPAVGALAVEKGDQQ